MVHESTVALRGYDGKLRQVIMKNNGRESPTFLVSNDTELEVELLVGNYARRWRVENSIAEAVSFFNLNALSSPILVKVHFDVLMTLIADTFYTMLARKLRGFEECDAPKLFRNLALIITPATQRVDFGYHPAGLWFYKVSYQFTYCCAWSWPEL